MHPGLLEAIRSQSAVVVVGTGLSVSATGGAKCANWTGLIEHGIETLRSADVRDDKWVATVQSMLAIGETSFVVQAASQVGDAFKELGQVAYGKWLEETVGALHPSKPELAEALVSLPIPLLTTNYDTLLEQVSDRGTATWRDPAHMQRILANRSKDVGHLHGAWNTPDSVILTADDYKDLTQSESAKAIQQAFGTSKSTIYLGVGSGLADPNFSRFLAWQNTTFPNPGLRDYRLCTDSELAGLQKTHIADNIVLVSYGSSHEELIPFLQSLRERLTDIAVSEDGLLIDPIGELRNDFADEMRREVIVGQESDEDAPRALDKVMLRPVLLPVPHAQYVSAKASEKERDSIDRLDPEQDIHTTDIVVLVGEENSGLTFAAKWLALRASQARPLLAPVYLNFTQCRAIAKPLLNGVRQQARAAGMVLGRTDDLPAVALVVDDYSPYVDKISERAAADLASLSEGFTIVTCRQGTEEDVQRRLSNEGLTVRLRYVGKLERGDIEHLARIAAPSQFKSLATSVMDLLRSEHLPRTPYTVSQLIYILINSGTVGANASSTSILEEYVALLLGRGDPHDDARVGLDHVQRMAILERLSERFVVDDTAGLAESAAVAAIEEIIDVLGWPESATEVLQNFVERHVLAKRDGFIVFARSSYLHLFAAKQAQKSGSFRDTLLARPLYYASAVGDYASLNRHDTVLLDRVEQLLGGLEWGTSEGTIFAELDLVEPSFVQPPGDQVSVDEHKSQSAQAEREPISDLSDDDPPPFPVANEEDEPRIWRQMKTIDLVSRILRDADQAGDVARKESLLGALLQQWGELITELDTDDTFQELFTSIADSMKSDENVPAGIDDDLLSELHRVIPAAIALGGISETLASRKLLRAMDLLVESGAAAKSPMSAVASIFFLSAVGEKGWPSKVRAVLKDQTNTWILRNFVFYVLGGAFVTGTSTSSDDADLLEACLLIVQRATHYQNDGERKRHENSLRSGLKKAREMYRKKLSARASISAASDSDGELGSAG